MGEHKTLMMRIHPPTRAERSIVYQYFNTHHGYTGINYKLFLLPLC